MKKMLRIMILVIMGALVITGCTGKMGTGGNRGDPETDFRVAPLDDGKAFEITEYVGGKQIISIPQRIGGVPVTRIGNYAFEDKEIISVTIPNSVTSIGTCAFEDNRLTSITIPNSVTTIEQDAFAYNPLTSITIGANIEVEENRGTLQGGDNHEGIRWEFFQRAWVRFYGKKAGTYTWSISADANSNYVGQSNEGYLSWEKK